MIHTLTIVPAQWNSTQSFHPLYTMVLPLNSFPRSSIVRLHNRSHIAHKIIPVGRKLAVHGLVRYIKASNGVMRVAQNGIDIALQRRRRLRVAVDEQRRLLRLHPVLIQSPDVGRPINGIGILKNVDVVGNVPVHAVHAAAGVEQYGIALGERLLGKGGGVLHVSLAAGVAG